MNLNPVQCDRCDLVCESRHSLAYHLIAVHGINYGRAQSFAKRAFGEQAGVESAQETAVASAIEVANVES